MEFKEPAIPFIFPYDMSMTYNTTKVMMENGKIKLRNEFDCELNRIEAVLSIVDVDSMMKTQQLWTKEFARFKPQPTIQQQKQLKIEKLKENAEKEQANENYLNINFAMKNAKIILTQLAFDSSTNRPLLASYVNEFRTFTFFFFI